MIDLIEALEAILEEAESQPTAVIGKTRRLVHSVPADLQTDRRFHDIMDALGRGVPSRALGFLREIQAEAAEKNETEVAS